MKNKIKMTFIFALVVGIFTTITMNTYAAQPHSSYWHPNSLLQWSPDSDEEAMFNRGSIPLAERITGNKVNDNAVEDAKLTALSIMNPNTSGVPSQGSDDFSVYTFSYWQYVDMLVMWGGSASEGIIVPPSADVIDAAHKNGVPVLGTVFFPPTVYGGDIQWLRDFLQQDIDGTFPVADKLIEVAGYYGFEGWFINQETSGGNSSDANAMQAFIKYAKSLRPDMHIMWYDAMTTSGSVSWQDELNDNNKMYLIDSNNETVADSMFIDFGWEYGTNLQDSNSKATSLGLDPYNLFAGIDVQANGYNSISTTKMNSWWPSTQANPYTSLGFYCPNWTFTESSSHDEYYSTDNKFWVGASGNPADTSEVVAGGWKGAANYFVATSPISQLPFVTNFNTGNGNKYYANGEMLRDKDWNNRSLQDVLPTWRWMAESTGTPLTPEFDFTTAYNGGTSIKVSGLLNSSNTTTLKLYKTSLPVDTNTSVAVSFLSPYSDSNMQIGVAFTDNPNQYDYYDVGTCTANSWTTKEVSLQSHAGRTISSIALKFESSNTISNYSINIGQLHISNKEQTSLQAVSSLTILNNDFREGLYTDAKLQWDKLNGATLYEIYRVKSNGEKELLGATPNNVYYVQEMIRDNGETVTTLEVKAINANFERGVAASVNFTWPNIPAPTADFGAVDNTVIMPGDQVTFEDMSSDTATSISWQFEGGNPSSSTAANPTVTYDTEGVYKVTLTASNSTGNNTIIKEGFITVTTDAGSVSNVALNKTATADAYINDSEVPAYAVDGTTSTKWCVVGDEDHWLEVDLGQNYNVYKFVINHAGAGGESADWNTKDFKIQLSDDGNTWTDVIDVVGNTLSTSIHSIASTSTRYVRLYITDPTQTMDVAVRLYDFEVWGY